MSLIGLRAGLGTDNSAQQTVERFFDALARSRLDKAKKLAARDLDWFGKPLRFDSPTLAAWIKAAPLSVSQVRSLSAETLEKIPEHVMERAFGGRLGEEDKIVFADVRRGEETTTVIAVVSAGAQPKLRRVLDPAAFVRFAEFAAVLHHVKP